MKEIRVPLHIISLLADGEFHSGEQLGEILGMSRAAVNKHIKTLQGWGLDVFTVPGKGYSLPTKIQLLNKQEIAQYLPEGRVTLLPVVDSTNQYLLSRIPELLCGDACVAEYQSSGRGRRGRHWFSPFGVNLYLSMYWRLEQGPAAAMGLSLVVGIVAAEVLNELGVRGVKVKWPNDLYVDDKKLAGILVEIIGKTGDVANIVMGIGINLAMSVSDPVVVNPQWINTTQTGVLIDRNQLVACLLRRLRTTLSEFEHQGLSPFLTRWSTLDNFVNRPVDLFIGDKVIAGIARGVDAQGALLLERNGEVIPFIGGEISLRPGK